MHSARRPGKKKFISAGASVFGVFWNTISTPSTVSVWPVWVTSSVGGINETVPDELVWPNPLPIWPAGPRRRGAVHVAGAAQHRRAGEDILGHGVLHEPLGSDHLDLAGRDLFLGDDALHPAEVVDMGVGVDHRPHRPVAAVLAVRREPAAAVSALISGSITITPVSPSTTVMIDRSKPRSW